MIWVNLSSILEVNKFSGIVRTEYEVCLYAYEQWQQGREIGFCTFDERIGFIEIDKDHISQVLNNLKNDEFTNIRKRDFKSRLHRSFLKRLNKIKSYMGSVQYCFKNGDTVISVGQKLGTNEIVYFKLIKKHIRLHLKFLCHDLIPMNHPEFAVPGAVEPFTRYVNQLVEVADYFYCNSQYTKNELVEYYRKINKEAPPMSIVTLGCDVKSVDKQGRISKFIEYLISQPYILFVSTIEVRKNHELIYDMYLKLLDMGVNNLPKVCFLGRRGWRVEKLLKNLDEDPKTKHLIFIADNVSDAELVTLYENCWFTIYPSFTEGYGLPVAESLLFGKYCLSSNGGSLPEAGGDYIDYINPYDLDKWCEKFLFLINNPDYIAKKEQHIKEHYRPVSWEQCAMQILNQEIN